MYIDVYALEYRCPWSPEEDAGSPGAGFTGGWKLSDMGAKNRALARTVFLLLSLSSPSGLFLEGHISYIYLIELNRGLSHLWCYLTSCPQTLGHTLCYSPYYKQWEYLLPLTTKTVANWLIEFIFLQMSSYYFYIFVAIPEWNYCSVKLKITKVSCCILPPPHI